MAQTVPQVPTDSQLLNLRLPPHSIDAEQSVLGGLLIDNGAFDRIGDVVTDSDFYRDDHRRIFRHIARLIERGKPADVVTVDESIKASEDKDKTGGITYLAALAAFLLRFVVEWPQSDRSLSWPRLRRSPPIPSC